MKIVFVSREYQPSQRCGGMGSFYTDLSKELCRLGHQVTVLCASDDTEQERIEVNEGISVHRLPGGDFCIAGIEGQATLARLRSWFRQSSRYTAYRKRVACEIDKLIENKCCDVVVCSEYGAETIAWAENKRATPLVVKCSGPTYLDRAVGRSAQFNFMQFPLKKIADDEYRLLCKADAIFAPSKAMADFVKKDVGLQKEICVIPNFIRFDEWAISFPKEIKNRIFFAGTVNAGKGAFDLVTAVKILRAQGLNLTLRMAGRLSEEGEKLKESLLNDNAYEFLGAISREALKKEYAEAALTCFPSWWEPFGIVCIEAMAAGALVLMSNKGGGPEIIEDGVNGFLIEPRDPKRLAAKIAEIMRLPEEQKAMIRKRAQEDVLKKFDSSVVVPIFVELFTRTIKEFNDKKIKRQ